MATANRAVLQDMQSKIMAMGWAENVVIGEPRSEMQSRTVAIIQEGGEVDEVTLSKPRKIHRVILRMYVGWLEEGQEDTEFLLDQFQEDISEDIFGDFDLGGTVAYALPAEFAWTYDEATVQDAPYRTVDILVAYRIDDNATFVK